MGQFDVIPFFNCTDTGFTFQYGGESYTVRAGETKMWPPFIAYHGAKHLIDRELIRVGKINLLNDSKERERIMGRILVAEVKTEEPEVSEDTTSLEVEEEFPDLKKLNPAGFPQEGVDLSRKEMFAKLRQLGVKTKAIVSNEGLKELIKENEPKPTDETNDANKTNATV